MEPDAGSQFKCLWCKNTFPNIGQLQNHLQTKHTNLFKPIEPPPAAIEPAIINFHKHKSSIKGFFVTYHANVINLKFGDILVFFETAYNDISRCVLSQLLQRKFLRLFITLECALLKVTEDRIVEPIHFNSFCEVITNEAFVPAIILTCRDKLISRLENYSREGSDFVLSQIKACYIHIGPFTPSVGGDFIRLPEKFHKRYGTINIRNCSQFCFYFACLSKMYPCQRRHKNTTAPYLCYLHELKINQQHVPMPLEGVLPFAEANGLSISVLGINEEEQIYPLLASPGYQDVEERNITLLFLQNAKRSHFVCVSNLSRLLGHASEKKPLFYCSICLNKFKSSSERNAHSKLCSQGNIQRLMFKRRFIQFTGQHSRVRSRVFACADFEAILIDNPRTERDASTSYTDKVADQVASAYSFAFFDQDLNVISYKTYVGKDASKRFLQDLLCEASKVTRLMDFVEPMKRLNAEERLRVTKTTHCDLCGVDFSIVEKVLDHSHSGEGRLRYVLCKKCNGAIQENNKITCYLHNMRKYDSRFILQGIQSSMEVNFVGKNLLDLVGIEVESFLRIVDSITLIPMSLEKAGAMLLRESRSYFRPFDQVFKDYGSHVDKLLRKLHYPFTWVNSFKKMEATSLPPKDAFFNSLKGSTLSDSEYQEVQDIWKAFDIKTFKSFTALYVLSDTLLLGCLVHRFCDVVFESINVCPTHYYSLPSVAYAAMLLHSKKRIQILTDPSMYALINNNITGGINTTGSIRYCESWNPYTHPDCPAGAMHRYIYYLDYTSYYANMLQLPLGIGNYRWLTNAESQYVVKNFQNVDWEKHQFVFEIDIKYPEHLKQDHNHKSLPILVGREEVSHEMLSEYQQQICANSSNNKKLKPSKRLLCSFKTKRNLVVTGSVLNFYLQMGMDLITIHRGFIMDVERWAKPYIDITTRMRREAANESVRLQSKLISNAAFGKVTQNEAKFRRIEIVRNQRDALKAAANPFFDSFEILNEQMTLISRRNPVVNVKRTSLPGFQVVMEARRIFLNFYHNVLCKEFEKVDMASCDTDGMIVVLETRKDPYEWMRKSPLFNQQGESTPGKLKLEFADNPITAVCSIKSKSYGLLLRDKQEHLRLKGVSGIVRDREIHFEDLKNVLFSGGETRHEQRSIRRLPDFGLAEIVQNKISLSTLDLKRKWISVTESEPFDDPPDKNGGTDI